LVPAGFPFGNTTKGNPERRLSARTLRATRAKARSARATNSGVVFLAFAFLALMNRSAAAQIYIIVLARGEPFQKRARAFANTSPSFPAFTFLAE